MIESSHSRVDPMTEASPVAIICGGGTFPFAIADIVQQRGRPVVLLALKDWADANRVGRYRHHWVAVGQAGRIFRLLTAERCRDVVLIGSVIRPPLSKMRPDWEMIRLMPRLIRLYYGGDDHLLSGVARIFEERGFSLLGAHEIAPEILVPEGKLGSFRPTAHDLVDIARAIALLKAMSPFDVGQAAVVADNQVLAVEAAEGTDLVLERIADLRAKGRIRTAPRTGVLVKAAKTGQVRRFDLPSIGPQTVELAARAGLAGIAVVAGETIITEPERVVALADRAQIFVVGLHRGGAE